MNFRHFGLVGLLTVALAFPAAAQTMRGDAVKPAPSIQTTTPTTASKATASTSAAIVDINSASATALDKLPGIGKSRAEAIIKNRPYKGKDDLLTRHIVPSNVYNGIKDKIIARQG